MRRKCQEKNDDEVEKVATIFLERGRPLFVPNHKR
jgi:hypothetical protein